jgi:hypothetical protein
LVEFGGSKIIVGFNNLVDGLDIEKDRAIILKRVEEFTSGA